MGLFYECEGCGRVNKREMYYCKVEWKLIEDKYLKYLNSDIEGYRIGDLIKHRSIMLCGECRSILANVRRNAYSIAAGLIRSKINNIYGNLEAKKEDANKKG